MRYLPAFFILLLACTPTTADQPATESAKKVSPYGWRLVPVFDEFGDSTGVDVMGLFPGTFSNSATLGDTLVAKFEFTATPDADSTVFFHLYEYGNVRVRFYESADIPIKIKVGSKRDTVIGWLYENLIIDADSELYETIIAATEPIKVAIDLSDASRTQSAKYQFVVDPSGLAEVFALLKR